MANVDTTIVVNAVNNASSVLNDAEKGFREFSKNAEKSIENISKKFKEVGDKLENTGKKFTTTVTLPILAAAGASTKFAIDMEENINKVNEVFGSSSKSIKDWSNSTLENFGIASVTALDMASLFGDMATSLGLGTDEAAEMSKSLTGLAGDLASFKNIGIDQATTALKGVFTGETESLKNLGVVMTQAALDSFALEQGINKTVSEMTEAEKVGLRYEFVLAKTANSQGDFARTSDGAANQTRTFTESLKEAGSLFGTVILPSYTKLVTFGNDVLKTLKEMDERSRNLTVGIAGVVAVIPPLLILLGSTTNAVITLIPVVKKIGVALKFLASNPIGLLIVALGTLTFLVVKNWDTIKQAIDIAAQRISLVLINLQEGFALFKLKVAEVFVSLVDRFVVPAVQKIIKVLNFLPGVEFDIGKISLSNLINVEQDKLAIQEHFAQKRAETIKKFMDKSNDIAKNQEPVINEEVAKESEKNAEKISKAVGGVSKKTKKETDKIKKDLERLEERFEKTFDSAKKDFESSANKFKEERKSITKDIDELKKSLVDLQKEFKLESEGIDKTVAERVVEQEKLVADLEKELLQRRVDREDSRDVSTELAKEKAALQDFLRDSVGFEEELTEARRRASLTDFDRFIEDTNAKRIESRKEFDERTEGINQEIANKQKELAEKKAIFEAEKSEFKKLVTTFVAGNLKMEASVSSSVSKMKEKFGELRDIVGEVSETLGGASVSTAGGVFSNLQASGQGSELEVSPIDTQKVVSNVEEFFKQLESESEASLDLAETHKEVANSLAEVSNEINNTAIKIERTTKSILRTPEPAVRASRVAGTSIQDVTAEQREEIERLISQDPQIAKLRQSIPATLARIEEVKRAQERGFRSPLIGGGSARAFISGAGIGLSGARSLLSRRESELRGIFASRARRGLLPSQQQEAAQNQTVNINVGSVDSPQRMRQIENMVTRVLQKNKQMAT